jgi:ribose transport system ATP-binding protein
MTDLLLDCADVRKTYGGIRALRGAQLQVERNSVHGLVGHNGAGKSTLVQIVAGLVKRDDGDVRVDGEVVGLGSRRAALALGILSVPQELTVMPGLSVAENICMGHEPNRGPWLRWRAMRDKAAQTLEQLETDLPLKAPVEDLAPSHQRIVMIAAALSQACRLLILDEPTASLAPDEAQALLALVERLPERGITVLFVSHRLDEVVRLCDRVTVMRDGLVTETLQRGTFDARDLVQRMVGDVPPRPRRPATHAGAEPAVRLDNVEVGPLRGVTLIAAKGAVTGITGLIGSGADELLHVIAGIRRPSNGAVEIDGERISFRSPADALASGVGYIASNRATAGLRELSVRENVCASSLSRAARFGFLSRAAERRRAGAFVASLGLEARLEGPLGTLSGGNQQKAIVARLLAADASVLVLNDPTAGVDVGARAELHRLLRSVVDEGRSVIVRSSEPEELVDLADVVHVVAGGRIVQTFTGDAIQVSAMLEASASSGHKVAA